MNNRQISKNAYLLFKKNAFIKILNLNSLDIEGTINYLYYIWET